MSFKEAMIELLPALDDSLRNGMDVGAGGPDNNDTARVNR